MLMPMRKKLDVADLNMMMCEFKRYVLDPTRNAEREMLRIISPETAFHLLEAAILKDYYVRKSDHFERKCAELERSQEQQT